MTKPVEGYLCNDGTFFENVEDAELYEAKQDLQRVAQGNSVNPESFVKYISQMRIEVMRYINAIHANQAKAIREQAGEATVDYEDDSSTEEANASVLEQPSSRG